MDLFNYKSSDGQIECTELMTEKRLIYFFFISMKRTRFSVLADFFSYVFKFYAQSVYVFVSVCVL